MTPPQAPKSSWLAQVIEASKAQPHVRSDYADQEIAKIREAWKRAAANCCGTARESKAD